MDAGEDPLCSRDGRLPWQILENAPGTRERHAAKITKSLSRLERGADPSDGDHRVHGGC